MILPIPIRAYFDADTDLAGAAPVHAFATDASVKDEGKTYTGRASIADWWRTAKVQYQHTAAPRDVSEADGRITVRAEVSGRFPGSPAMLSFMFTLNGDEIVTLEIGT